MRTALYLIVILFLASAIIAVDLGNSGGFQEDCPSATPLRCANSQCVADVSNCPINNCNGTTPYLCSDGSTCAISAIYCNCQGVLCSDGSCKSSFQSCKLLEGCSELLPKRCGDGSCAAYNSNCTNHTGTVCPSPLVRCMDGICRLSSACNGIPYYGCVNYQCPNGSCTTNYNDCLCPGDPTKVKCYDGSCSPIGTLCAVKAPLFINPMNLTYTIQTSTPTTISVVQTTNTSPSGNIASVTFAAGSLTANSGAATQLVNVNGVASSISQNLQVTNPVVGTSAPAITVSPIISVTVGNGNSVLSGNGATIQFNNLPAGNLSSLCVASVNDANNTATCINTTTNGTSSLQAAVSHFSSYVVIKKPACQASGSEAPQSFCSRQVWHTGTIGFYCSNEGKKFYMCWEAPNTASSSLMSCPAGTTCSCCDGDECSSNGTQSPCRF